MSLIADAYVVPRKLLLIRLFQRTQGPGTNIRIISMIYSSIAMHHFVLLNFQLFIIYIFQSLS